MLGIASNTQNQGQCKICQGAGAVNQKNGAVQVCPLCEGTGRWEPPYNRVPMTYPIHNGSTLVLGASAGGGVAGTPVASFLNITGDYDFEAWLMVGVSNPGTNAPGLWQDQISDQTYPWQQNGIFIVSANRWGTIQWPMELAPRVIMPRKHVMNYQAADLSGAQNTIQACFVGYDLHPILG